MLEMFIAWELWGWVGLLLFSPLFFVVLHFVLQALGYIEDQFKKRNKDD